MGETLWRFESSSRHQFKEVSLQLIHNPNQSIYTIQSFSPGKIEINHTIYTHSLIALPNQIITDWPPQTMDMLAAKHVDRMTQLSPEIILIGTGIQQHLIPSLLLMKLIEAKIGFEAMSTAAACRTFNLLASEGRKVAAGLIIS